VPHLSRFFTGEQGTDRWRGSTGQKQGKNGAAFRRGFVNRPQFLPSFALFSVIPSEVEGSRSVRHYNSDPLEKVNPRSFFLYFAASLSRRLYVGVTNDLSRRMYEHKEKSLPGFTSRYNVSRLVYFEEFSDAISAIEREKQIKRWARAKKIFLIEKNNPGWDDLSDGWYE